MYDKIIIFSSCGFFMNTLQCYICEFKFGKSDCFDFIVNFIADIYLIFGIIIIVFIQ